MSYVARRKLPKKEASADRPILIDEKDGRCELCAEHSDGKCDVCGKKLDPKDPEMKGHGYQSVRPTHYHLEVIGGEGLMAPGRRSMFAELCYKCHRADRKKVYGADYGEKGLISPE